MAFVAPVPEGIDAETAATVAMAGTTAHVLTRVAERVEPDATMLVL